MQLKNGEWFLPIYLAPGKYTYKFIVKDKDGNELWNNPVKLNVPWRPAICLAGVVLVDEDQLARLAGGGRRDGQPERKERGDHSRVGAGTATISVSHGWA